MATGILSWWSGLRRRPCREQATYFLYYPLVAVSAGFAFYYYARLPCASSAKITTDLIKPLRQQPFWLAPLAATCKTLITFAAFDFDLNFSEPNESCSCCKCLAQVLQWCVGICLIGCVISSYCVDVRRFHEWHSEHGDSSHIVTLLGMCVTVVMSSNFASAIAIWSKLAIQSPVALLDLKNNLNYRVAFGCICDMGFPLFPCTCTLAWLTPLKYIYAVLLLPYKVLGAAFAVCLYFIGYAFIALRVFAAFITFGIILSGKGSAEAIDPHGHASDSVVLILVLGIIVLWIPAVQDRILVWFYSRLKGMPYSEYTKGVNYSRHVGLTLWQALLRMFRDRQSAREHLCNYFKSFIAPVRVPLEPHDIAALTRFNQGLIQKIVRTPVQLDLAEGYELMQEHGDGLDDSRVAIIYGTLRSVRHTVPLQFLVMYLFYLVAASQETALVQVMCERSVESYLEYMYTSTVELLHQYSWERFVMSVSSWWNV